MFNKQFFGKLTLPTLGTIAAMHVIAIFARGSVVELPLLILIGLIVAVLSFRKLEYGLYIAFAEIFVGGHGHLLDATLFGFSVSLRIVIFGAVMAIWALQTLRGRIKPSFVASRDVPWAVLLAAVVLGTVIGFAGNEAGKAFDDMNGYLTLFYLLPLISIQWDQTKKRELLQIFSAGAAWLVFFTLLLSFLFTHLDGKSLSHVYRFVRDSRLAEITLQTVSNGSGTVTDKTLAMFFGADGYWYRIFMQSQFFVMVAGLLVLSMMYFVWRGQRLPWQTSLAFVMLAAVIPLSSSRSFILGLVVCAGLLGLLSLLHGKKRLTSTSTRSILAGVLLLAGFGVAWASVVFPLPPQPDISDAAFYSSSADADRELAVSSRWQLLGPMMKEIYSSPLLGSGFGEEVTFISDDPRVRAVNPNGEWTTYRFEWGYQDIWLKMGILGIIAFILYAYAVLRASIYTAKRHGHQWLVFGLGAGVVLLFVANVFTPFLNHPIGIGYMLFVLPFFDWEKKKETENVAVVANIAKVAMPEMTPVMRVEEVDG